MPAPATASTTGLLSAPVTNGNTSQGAVQKAPSVSPNTTTSPVSRGGRTVIDETVALIGGDRSSAKKYSFQDFGIDLSHPNDTFVVSVRADKPINVLVTDYRGQGDFNGVTPVWEVQPLTTTTNTHLYGWSYPGIWSLVDVDEIYSKEFTFTLSDPGAYYLILDPQTIGEQVYEGGRWQVKHDNFKVHVKVVDVGQSREPPKVTPSEYIINETVALYDGGRTGWKEYPLEDYGLKFVYPGDSFVLSVVAEKPVNVMVVDINNENRFGTIKPVYEIQPVQGNTGTQYGYSYPGLTTLVKEDKVVKKDIAFTIKDLGKYYVILDDRFADPESKTIGYFRADVNLQKTGCSS